VVRLARIAGVLLLTGSLLRESLERNVRNYA
jgi:hypothetical protein